MDRFSFERASAIARKELRAYFLSPVALLVVGAFLLASLFSFFWVEGFFARNVADVRPLFRNLPLLLVFLAPAVGMRLWSEEERTGTYELLGTLPIRPAELVVGKFAAGLALVGVALLGTLPLPLTVSFLGDLDWGPVAGGYLATLLLAGAYLALSQTLSATTPNQIVALVFGVLACGGLHLVGSEPVVGFFGHETGELLRALGAGARFESILRGVVDGRDLLYYASLTAVFLAANVGLLQARRWSDSEAGAPRRRDARLFVALLTANLLAVNAVVAPVRALRLDLTEHREYTISPVTKELLQGLDEPLLIRGYFSEKTHPLLAPLVPRIRDLIREYGAVGGDAVRAEFLDPTTSEELEAEAGRDYGIRSVPFEFASRHEASVVNSYFHVLVRYGDQFQVLSFDDVDRIARTEVARGAAVDRKDAAVAAPGRGGGDTSHLLRWHRGGARALP